MGWNWSASSGVPPFPTFEFHSVCAVPCAISAVRCPAKCPDTTTTSPFAARPVVSSILAPNNNEDHQRDARGGVDPDNADVVLAEGAAGVIGEAVGFGGITKVVLWERALLMPLLYDYWTMVIGIL